MAVDTMSRSGFAYWNTLPSNTIGAAASQYPFAAVRRPIHPTAVFRWRVQGKEVTIRTRPDHHALVERTPRLSGRSSGPVGTYS